MDKRLILLGLNELSIGVLEQCKLPNTILITDTRQKSAMDLPGHAELLICSNKAALQAQLERLQVSNDDLIISIGCPWIIESSHLSLCNHRVLNLHGTHLPLYRGGTIYSWYILNRRRTGMCLLHKMTKDIDRGGIVAWEEYMIPPSCRIPLDFMDLYNRMNLEFLSKIINEWNLQGKHPADAQATGQPEYLSSYWPRLKAIDHAWIDWQWPGVELESFICAFDDPYDGTKTRWREQLVRLKEVYFQSGNLANHPFQFGQVFRVNHNWLTVAVNGGELLINKILGENSEDLLSKIKVGERFFTTNEDLLNHHTRVFKTQQGLESRKYW